MAKVKRSSGQWDTKELLVLVDSKKYQMALNSSRERVWTGEQRWKEIEDLCMASNVRRGWKPCKIRWEKLLIEFLKIWDFQTYTQSGGDGYFQLSRSEKKIRSLPTTFEEDIYKAMASFIPAYRAVNPDPSQYVDSTADAEAEGAFGLFNRYTPDMTPGAHSTPSNNSDLDGDDTIPHSHDVGIDRPDDEADPFDGSADRSIPSQPTSKRSGRRRSPITGQEDVNPSTSWGWKRKKVEERTLDELHKVTDLYECESLTRQSVTFTNHCFVKSMEENRMGRREEHNELLQFIKRRHVDLLSAQAEATRLAQVAQAEATRSARQTRADIATALSLIVDSVRHLCGQC